MTYRKLRPGAVPPTTTCNARTRGKTLCRLKAGWHTDHSGAGRCRLHGGIRPAGEPQVMLPKHRLWAAVARHGLQPSEEDITEELILLEDVAGPLAASAPDYVRALQTWFTWERRGHPAHVPTAFRLAKPEALRRVLREWPQLQQRLAEMSAA